MPVHLYLAPAGAGKTSYLIGRARVAALRGATVRVVVATRHQVHAWQRRLAEAGGALGVQVGTFDTLYRGVLRAAGEVYVRLSDPVQYRLLQTLIAAADLAHYRPLRTAPGFVRVVMSMIGELKAGGVFPEALLAAIQGMGDLPRLRELGALYQAYQAHLQNKGWADAAGIGWLAQEALQRRPELAAGWPCLLVDGFDDLTSVQLAVLRELSGRVGELAISLTGELDRPRPQAHRRFARTRERIEARLGVAAQALPERAGSACYAPALAHLQKTLYQRDAGLPVEAGGAISLIATTDREGEVRAALRWLKQRAVQDGVPLRSAALLARSMDAYRPYVQQVADEYGLPVVFASGTPLRGNPAVAALLDLVQLAAPGADGFPWRQTVEAWRSPYLRWLAADQEDLDPDALDRVARWGSVIGGLEQWREALDRLVEALVISSAKSPPDREEEGAASVEVLPDAAAAESLRVQFERFVAQVTPPPGELPCRRFVAWIESLIGDEVRAGAASPDPASSDLESAAVQGVLQAALDAPKPLADRDREALIAFKDVLRGLVWAAEALDSPPSTFVALLDDLTGAVNTALYRPPVPDDRETLLAADVTQARGVVYDAVAVLGLAEGEFPTALMEDPFLRDADRRRLKDDYGLEVDPSTTSAEAAYFYEAVTRARRALLLTRPRIADNGALWQASPYWDEVQRRVAVAPLALSSAHETPPAEAASWPELLRACSAYAAGALAAGGDPVWDWLYSLDAEKGRALALSAQVLVHRSGETPSPYDGGLEPWGETFAERFGPRHTWSASRLESYRACPLFFYVGSVLHLEPRAAPAEGLDARQLGNLYHRLMERVYQHPDVDDPTDVEQLLAVLPGVAATLLDAAPRQEGFRITAWWEETRREIVEHVRDSLRALNQLRGGYAPFAYERAFGLDDQPALEIRDPERGDTLRVRGLIDRVDVAPDGRVRIIDYKTGGPGSFSKRAFLEGKKLQLALYACAAEQALGLGEVRDGYYWHVRRAAWHLEHERKGDWVTLSKLGIEDAIDIALNHSWEAVRAVRSGQFAPHPPSEGCPGYCPAAAFCWHYAPREW